MNLLKWYRVGRRLGAGNEVLTRAYNAFGTVRNVVRYGNPDMPVDVTIETSTFCNRKCYYCPNSKHETPVEFMRSDVFEKTIADLVAMRFCGRIMWNFYNEPLLDPSLLRRIVYAKARLPQCYHMVFTNGDALNEPVVQRFIAAGVNCFVVTNHNIPESIAAVDHDLRMGWLAAQYGKHIRIRPPIHNRHSAKAGLIPSGEPMHGECAVVRMPIVTITGDVLLCCNDYMRKHVFGNVMEKPLLEIWQDVEYDHVRRQLRKGNLPRAICKRCYGEEA